MSERKEQFTPGPWKYDTKSSMIHAETGETIGEIFDCDDLKNGPLAAAAPEMYVSLKDMVLTVTDLLEAICSGEENTDCLIAVVQDEIDNAVKVLKKTRGEENE